MSKFSHGAKVLVTAMLIATYLHESVQGQTFNSGSTGVDGPLVITASGNFDPVALGLDADGDGIYNFSTITIAPSVTVTMRANTMPNRPVVWLATGDVAIYGTIDIGGNDGHSNGATLATNAVPGPGGFYGGLGINSTSGIAPQPGQGPGGGQVATGPAGGGGGGHAVAGETGHTTSSNQVTAPGGTGGAAYGSMLIQPLVGGSGGAGGGNPAVPGSGGGGGAGGGAILIATSTKIITSSGASINASGGFGGNSGSTGGGAGGGGAIRLVAPTLQLTGLTLNARGGDNPNSYGYGGDGAAGRIRLEGNLTGTPNSVSPLAITGTTGSVFATALPSVRVSKVAGAALPLSPKAGSNPADVTINQAGNTTLDIEADKIPEGTIVKLRMTADTGAVLNADSTPLTLTAPGATTSTATALINIPNGVSRFSVYASWTNP